MVDCGSLRCAQERRSFRRDLQGWSKKLPLVLGLERIAADYVDNDTAKLLLNPYPAWEQELTQDFEPLKRCFHCDKRLPNIYRRVQRIINDAKKGKENNGKICLKSLQDLVPFCADFYTQSFGQELFSDVVKSYFLSGVQQPEPQEEPEPHVAPSLGNETIAKLKVPHLTIARSNKKSEAGKQSYTEKDLDCAISDIRSGRLGTRRAAMIYGIPRSTLRSKVVKPDHEEIVLPRDENERPCVVDLNFHKPCLHHLPSFQMSELGLFDLNQPARNRDREPASLLLPMKSPINIKLEPDDQEFFHEHRLKQIRRMHNLNGLRGVHPRPAHVNHLKLPLLIDVVRKLVRQRFMEVKHDHGWKENSFEINSKSDTELFSPFGPYLPAFSSRMSSAYCDENHSSPVYKCIMDSLYTYKMRDETSVPKPFGKVNESSRIGDTLKDIIAKTISEKMKLRDSNSDEFESPLETCLPSTPETHTTFIGRSRNENLGLEPKVVQTGKESKSLNDCCSPPKRSRKDHGKLECISPVFTTHNSSSSAKKTRPKRGQYRKYNSQLLMDAVKAVQRGEMSVHRAGSYFGVPHSTLEYKVKERHLMRQKKPKEAQLPCSSSKSAAVPSVSQTTDRESSLTPEDDGLFTSKKLSGSSSARSSVSSTSPPPNISCRSKTPPACPSQSFPSSSSSSPLPLTSSALNMPPNKDLSNFVWFQPYLASTSQHLDSSIGLIPPSLSHNNSASELLRQLQYKVQAKSSSFQTDCPFDLPCTKERVFEFTQSNNIGAAMSDRMALYNESI
ncbi:unnamed protein product [Candidula unifasciata]|uniref:HTH psq-type domain-containing protein n=1 Tax=Candidula unifasciata TaxID=100452 RepID=A0A8S3ZD96_9EUPU|nr:unnamed protein product [Candidula unifasciata]